MLKKTSIKSLFRITALTMAFLIFAVTGAQSYSLAASAETLQGDQEAVNSTVESNSPEPTNNETPNITEEAPNDETLNNDEETSLDDNFHNVNVGDLEIMGEDTSPEASMFVLPIVWAGMGIGQLLGWLAGGTAAVVTIVKFGENVARVADFAAELRKSKQKDKPRYYKAKIDKQGMYIFKGLTDEEALKHLKDSSSNDVWTPLETDAKSLALKYAVSIVGVGSIKITEKESHHLTGYNDTRYYLHYHGEKIGIKRSGHIFYDSTGRMGVNPR
ncbi:hypothetical protein [Paenibacillus sp. FSL H8-0283]|uniref:hypothetical protein n=1 Tax=Paenibacillus sp. FSL H8-0283 TaxID=2921383 RepID=UPI00324338D1